MANEHANLVVINNQTIIDLTSDTVTADKIYYGYTAHDASGALITGTKKSFPIEPIAYDYEMGYTSSATWTYQDSTNNHTDVYEIEEGHVYLLGLGGTVGTRFRAAQLPSNPVGSTVNITGTLVINTTNPKAYASATFTANYNGWLCVTKDNAYTKGLKSYLFDVTRE